MDDTLDILPGQGVEVTTHKTRCRRECDNCGEPAHYKITFLLPNARNNPASKAYQHDDCAWCEDEAQFSCKNGRCREAMRKMDGYGECSTFPASERFARMFLYWKEIK